MAQPVRTTLQLGDRRTCGLVAALSLAMVWLQACDAQAPPTVAAQPAQQAHKATTTLPKIKKPGAGAAVELPPPPTCTIGEKPPATAFDQVPRLDKCIAPVPDDWPSGLVPGDAVDTALGYRDDVAGPVKPWHDGDAAVLSQGMQGTGHVQTDVMLALPQAKASTMTVQVMRQVWYDCDYHHESPPTPVKLVPGPVAGWWVPEKPLRTIVNMPMHLACGRWVRLQVLVQLPGENHWHAVACTLKLWVAMPIQGEYN